MRLCKWDGNAFMGRGSVHELGSTATYLGMKNQGRETLIYFMAAQRRKYRDMPNADLNAGIALYRAAFYLEQVARGDKSQLQQAQGPPARNPLPAATRLSAACFPRKRDAHHRPSHAMPVCAVLRVRIASIRSETPATAAAPLLDPCQAWSHDMFEFAVSFRRSEIAPDNLKIYHMPHPNCRVRWEVHWTPLRVHPAPAA